LPVSAWPAVTFAVNDPRVVLVSTSEGLTVIASAPLWLFLNDAR